MSVPNCFDLVQSFVVPRLGLEPTEEATRERSFWACNDGCLEARKTDKNWGLLVKTGGAQVQNRAADVWLYIIGPTQAMVIDMIANAEGSGGTAPAGAWQEKDIRSISEWVEPYPASQPGPNPPNSDLEARLAALERNAVQYGQRIGLRADAGSVICAENGGPSGEDGQSFNLTSRQHVGPWESWKVERGQ